MLKAAGRAKTAVARVARTMESRQGWPCHPIDHQDYNCAGEEDRCGKPYRTRARAAPAAAHETVVPADAVLRCTGVWGPHGLRGIAPRGIESDGADRDQSPCRHPGYAAFAARGLESPVSFAFNRFLSRDEARRLHAELDRLVAERPKRATQADVVRLLYYTGCRLSEIRTLRWCEVGADTLDLGGRKTGPRKVYLNSKAREIINRQPRTGGDHVFPSQIGTGYPSLWFTLRRRAGIEDVRLHDLRHTFASLAVLNGVPLPTVARLLGHRKVSMTLRYAHVADREVEAAAERIGAAFIKICGGDGGQRAPAPIRPPRPCRRIPR